MINIGYTFKGKHRPLIRSFVKIKELDLERQSKCDSQTIKLLIVLENNGNRFNQFWDEIDQQMNNPTINRLTRRYRRKTIRDLVGLSWNDG